MQLKCNFSRQRSCQYYYIDAPHGCWLSVYGEKAWQQSYENATSYTQQRRSKDKLISDVRRWTLHTDKQVLDNQQELINNSSEWTQGVVWRTCWKWWTIEKNGKRESGKSMQVAGIDKDLNIYTYICVFVWIYICVYVRVCMRTCIYICIV